MTPRDDVWDGEFGPQARVAAQASALVCLHLLQALWEGRLLGVTGDRAMLGALTCRQLAQEATCRQGPSMLVANWQWLPAPSDVEAAGAEQVSGLSILAFSMLGEAEWRGRVGEGARGSACRKT